MSRKVATDLFKAEWPEALKPTLLGTVSWGVYSITPIGLIHHLVFWLGRFLVHPASAIHLFDEASRNKLLDLGGKIVKFQTPDGETLEGMIFKSRVGSGKGVVCALGNGFCLDHAEDQVQFFNEYVSDADLLVLNYRGVGKSTGASSPLGLALDVYSACEYLHQVHEVDPSEQIVYGHSLGGYAAVKGGALFQAAHPDKEVSVISDRSFSSLSEAARRIAGAFFSFLAFLLRWELDARDDWDVFRGKKIVINDKKDALIPFDVSFYHAIKDKKNTTFIDMESDEEEGLEPHMRPFTSTEARAIAYALN
jgi:fermentation-respiration switch protein FrsA (DUF1100 family)